MAAAAGLTPPLSPPAATATAGARAAHRPASSSSTSDRDTSSPRSPPPATTSHLGVGDAARRVAASSSSSSSTKRKGSAPKNILTAAASPSSGSSGPIDADRLHAGSAASLPSSPPASQPMRPTNSSSSSSSAGGLKVRDRAGSSTSTGSSTGSGRRRRGSYHSAASASSRKGSHAGSPRSPASVSQQRQYDGGSTDGTTPAAGVAHAQLPDAVYQLPMAGVYVAGGGMGSSRLEVPSFVAAGQPPRTPVSPVSPMSAVHDGGVAPQRLLSPLPPHPRSHSLAVEHQQAVAMANGVAAGPSAPSVAPALAWSGRAASLPGDRAGAAGPGSAASSRTRASTTQAHQAAAAAAAAAAAHHQHPQMSAALAAMASVAAAAAAASAGNKTAATLGSHTPFLRSLPPQYSMQQHLQLSYERYTAELTNCIIGFLSPILPTEEEYRIKEATRRQLERLAGKVSPGAKLLAFGSMANGFALRNSDMDLCCLIAEQTPHYNASELVETLGQLIREETDFKVLPLPMARIPIIKISRAPTVDLPYEISCDIGFENRLALENTRLLLSYAMVDPPRLRTLVLFLKIWTKRRKLNTPYMGTLSSYGYTLLVLFFLTHVKRPPVLPNLQRIPPTRPLAPEEVELNGHNIYFYDDVATLRREWASQNSENVGELLIDFFRYFSKEFAYTKDVVSLRTEGGLMAKDAKAWTGELCIEDPFQLGYNVARTVTKDGLYTIRGEFMRASRILSTRADRVTSVLQELCEEREDGLTRAPEPSSSSSSSRRSNTASSLSAASSMGGGPHPQQRFRRHHQDHSHPRAWGGSFAFEEMARGLVRGGGRSAVHPTAAMLAPLSQTDGLSHARSTGGAKAVVPSSARSEDGGGVLGRGGVNAGTPSGVKKPPHASARTSPREAPALVRGSAPLPIDVDANGGLPQEIVFGTERFELRAPSVGSAAGGVRHSEPDSSPPTLRKPSNSTCLSTPPSRSAARSHSVAPPRPSWPPTFGAAPLATRSASVGSVAASSSSSSDDADDALSTISGVIGGSGPKVSEQEALRIQTWAERSATGEAPDDDASSVAASVAVAAPNDTPRQLHFAELRIRDDRDDLKTPTNGAQ